MQYRPDTKTKVDTFVVGRVVQDIPIRKVLSPSILVLDRRAVIEPIGGLASSGQDHIDLDYSSSSYAGLEVSKTYIFAIAGDRCVGFFEVQDDRVILPDESSTALDDFMATQVGRAFPSYNGGEL